MCFECSGVEYSSLGPFQISENKHRVFEFWVVEYYSLVSLSNLIDIRNLKQTGLLSSGVWSTIRCVPFQISEIIKINDLFYRSPRWQKRKRKGGRSQTTLLFVCMSVASSIYIYIYTHMYTHMCIYIYIYTHMCIHMCIYIYIYRRSNRHTNKQ